MMTISDRYIKILLTIIAVTLLIIALNPWIAPKETTALPDSDPYVRRIASDVENIAIGACANRKIC